MNTLTADQLEYLIDTAEAHWLERAPDSDHWQPLVKAGREQVRLMRLPINSDTLRHEAGFLYGGLGTMVHVDAPVVVQTDIEGNGWSVRHGTRIVPNVESIADLLELVRQAGRAKVTP